MALLKFFHVFFVFIWMGSLITISGFLAYQKEGHKELTRLLKKAYFGADFPAMLLAIVCGISLLIVKDVNWRAPWLHMKFTLVFFLIILDVISGSLIYRLKTGSARFGSFGRRCLHYSILACLAAILAAIYLLKP